MTPIIPLNFLFVGIEPSFKAYFFTKEEALNASVDSCRTVKEARQKLLSTLYDVYVIDLDDPDALNLVQEIRLKAPDCVIAVTTEVDNEEKELEALLTLHIVNYVLLKPLEPQQVDEMFHGLCKHFAKNIEDKPLIPTTGNGRPLVYIVDPDFSFLELLHKVKSSFPFELQTDSDPRKALERLHKTNFNPQVLIISDVFPGSYIHAFEIIENEQVKAKNPTLITALILGNGPVEDDVEARMKATSHNINYVFHKPLFAHSILKSIEEILQVKNRQNFKVLILDDDQDFCGFVSEILKDAGMEVMAIHDGGQLFKALDEFQPQLVLLDVILPQFNGLDLLRTLRHDITYAHLIVVIITSGKENTTMLTAYSAKADDIIYKPIDPILFQKRMINFSERYVHLSDDSSCKQDGIECTKELILSIHDQLKKPESAPHFLVLFEVNKFNDWLKIHTAKERQELLISIGNQLLSEFAYEKACYHLKNSEYAILFQNESLEKVKSKVEGLSNRLVERESLSSIQLNVSITPILSKYVNAEQNLKFAEQTLMEASKQENKSVRLLTVASDEDKPKEIMLIDGDLQLLKILKTTFESHGVHVTTYAEGETALEDLLKRSFEDLPNLVIVERKLIDMDGIDILAKLKIHFKKTIPFYMLTFYSSDKDILDGIKLGALEYITKPFNTSILVEKVLKVLYPESIPS